MCALKGVVIRPFGKWNIRCVSARFKSNYNHRWLCVFNDKLNYVALFCVRTAKCSGQSAEVIPRGKCGIKDSTSTGPADKLPCGIKGEIAYERF